MMKTILYSDDINLLAHWERTCDTDCVVVDDFNTLKSSTGNVIITNYSALKSDKKELLNLLDKSKNLVLVLDRTPNIQTAKELLSYGAKGYGNALMKGHFILAAIDTMKDGMVWLHPEFTSQLIAQIPAKVDKDLSVYLKDLSQREQEVALLLKDGATYNTIAQELDITPRTVKAHAHNIFIKLHVKDRLALALLLK